MRILVCGTREWSGTWEDIGIHLPEPEPDTIVTIIHGACSRLVKRNGALCEVSVDMIANFVARRLGFAVDSYPVDHSKDGPWPAAGPRRNGRMLADGRPDRGLAFGALWKIDEDASYRLRRDRYMHSGTGDMVAKLLRANLPVRWISAPGAEPIDLTEMPEPPR